MTKYYHENNNKKGENKREKKRRQNNEFPQGSVLAPILFNIYTIDQPIGNLMKHFIYADDLMINTMEGLSKNNL